jgi:drug/metabolite transporter (DMT)-like permease
VNVLLPVLFAILAAVGNGFFAVGQKQAGGMANPMLYIAGSVLSAGILAALAAPFVGAVSAQLLRQNAFYLGVSGFGLFLTYIGFVLMYRYGASYYVVYAAASIITTSVVVGFLLYKEPVNGYHIAAVITALATVVLFSVGQARH